MKSCWLLFIGALLLLTTGCRRQMADFDPGPPMESFVLTTVGSYIIYQVDSTVYPNFGRDIAQRPSQEKHTVGAVMQDNLGRTSYRIDRSIRNAAGTSAWTPAGTYMITPTGSTLEIIQNNQRVVRLSSPITQGRTWKGNRYLPSRPYQDLYSFENDLNIESWDFKYTSVADTFRMGNQTLDKVVSVLQVDIDDKADTITVTGNRVNIPDSITAVVLRGGTGDTIRITADPPRNFKPLQIVNLTGRFAKLNAVTIPNNKSFGFEFDNGEWTYPSLLKVQNNLGTLPGNSSQYYVVGNPTSRVRLFTQLIDTGDAKSITVYNRTNQNVFVEFDTALAKVPIAPGLGRLYTWKRSLLAWTTSADPADIKTTDGFNESASNASRSYSLEKWAPGIGMLYQHLVLWTYRTDTGPTPFYLGFAVRRRIIEYRRN